MFTIFVGPQQARGKHDAAIEAMKRQTEAWNKQAAAWDEQAEAWKDSSQTWMQNAGSFQSVDGVLKRTLSLPDCAQESDMSATGRANAKMTRVKALALPKRLTYKLRNRAARMDYLETLKVCTSVWIIFSAALGALYFAVVVCVWRVLLAGGVAVVQGFHYVVSVCFVLFGRSIPSK